MLRRAGLLLMAAWLAGCSSLPGSHDQHVPAPSSEMIQAAQLGRYIADLQIVVQGSPTEQAEVVASARAAHEQARQGPAALRYGLLLAVPAHPAHDAGQAQRLLRDALARPELLSAAERALATVELARVDGELRLAAEIDRLSAELQQERDRQRTAAASAATTRRLQTDLQTEQAESARLRKALDEARAKLDALTRIERNYSDRPTTAPEGRNP